MTTIEKTRPPGMAAAELVSRLHDQLAVAGVDDPDDRAWWLTRYLLCVAGEDTGTFPARSVRDLLEHIDDDASDAGFRFKAFFGAIATPPAERHPDLPAYLRRLPHLPVWFARPGIPEPVVSPSMLATLIAIARSDWGDVDFAVTGAVPQIAGGAGDRRHAGANYTREETIRSVTGPLITDGLRDDFEAAAGDRGGLVALLARIGRTTVLDPAAGTGSFLAVAYRDLRALESDVRAALAGIDPAAAAGPAVVVPANFRGIELDPLAHRISELVMALAVERAGRGSLAASGAAGLRRGDALELDWSRVAPAHDDLRVCGNPPFSNIALTPGQRAARDRIWKGIDGTGQLDLCSCWFFKAANLIAGTGARAALVATSSIAQGSQVGPLWGTLRDRGMRIDFARQPFVWGNSAPNATGVHVVVVGFSDSGRAGAGRPELYRDARMVRERDPDRPEVINGYLVAGKDVVVSPATKPVSWQLSKLRAGVNFSDGSEGKEVGERNAGLIMDAAGRAEVMAGLSEVMPEAAAAGLVREFVGGLELVRGPRRWCLWLVDSEVWDRAVPVVSRRLGNVARARSMMVTEAAREAALTPWMPMGGIYDGPVGERLLLVPSAGTGKGRKYIPAAFASPDVVPSSTTLVGYNGGLLDFAVVSSRHFRLWSDAICGRLRADARVNVQLGWNTFPLPPLGGGMIDNLESAAKGVLASRVPGAPLRFSYDVDRMPSRLLDAHGVLDREADEVYGLVDFTDEARLARLFELYELSQVPPQLF